ncbi:hypothetical protein PF002_g30076 [Phytophthora fragariae]|uniref:Tc1-like transposase DDE domain-containing protein n=3 Tax=Phytophthora fragariae TaxID=53985 RepID=A0A6A3VND8_9STRA|nr:hypothetical protein PF003_g15152 [Phytophthora fragariae]KAE8919684.1 hypothetical protein PF009_g30013 [Phytophthora fragariae]KAE9071517.1 hypothetical protein PF006_g29132 [Phytophthora fragariae]KAE9170481.1 hypothetical protein PF002_g30076 [Phytophthora fragariae]
MSSQASFLKHSPAEKRRVLEAHRAGRADWLTVAANNGISRSMAYRIANSGRVDDLPRGGARAGSVKVTQEVKDTLESYLNDNCTYTMETMRSMLGLDMGVDVSTSTISRHLLGILYTVKQTRVVPMTCKAEANKIKRQAFAQSLKKHQRDGDCIVYFEKTNFNVYCKRGHSRAKKGKRATLVMPPSKGANLQVQCAVNSAMGVVLYRLERGSIQMEQNAAFINDIYRTVKSSAFFRENYGGKKIVVVLDNAPAHRQTEQRVEPHDDLVLLRLAPYSPMCNPFEGCFSVLKAHTKEHLALDREAICDRSNLADRDGNRLTIKERTMRFLERAVRASIKYITPLIVTKMELHARDSVNAAESMEDMVYGQ